MRAGATLKRFDQDQGYRSDALVRESGKPTRVRLPDGQTRRVAGMMMGTESGIVRNIGAIFEAEDGDDGFTDYVSP